MKKTIRFYNTYEPVTSFYRDVPRALSECGYKVELVVSRAEYRATETRLEDAVSKYGVHVKRIGFRSVGSTGSSNSKIITMISYSISSLLFSFRNRSTINIFLTQPPFFYLLGLLLKKIRGESYICVLMDLYPEVLIANGVIKPNGWIASFMKTWSSRVLNSANAIIVIGRDMERIVEHKGVQPKCIHYIPNWAADAEVYPVEKSNNSLRQELGFNDDDFIVLYSGNLGVSHYFDDILYTALECRHTVTIKFVFIGSGARLSEVEKYKCKHKLENIVLLAYQPLTRLAESLSLGDIHFVSLRQGFDGLVVPSKVFGAMAVGRPVLYQGSEKSEIASIIKKHNIGCQVEIGDRVGLKSAIENYHANRMSLIDQGNSARVAYNDEYCAQIAKKKYVDLINTIVDANESLEMDPKNWTAS